MRLVDIVERSYEYLPKQLDVYEAIVVAIIDSMMEESEARIVKRELRKMCGGEIMLFDVINAFDRDDWVMCSVPPDVVSLIVECNTANNPSTRLSVGRFSRVRDLNDSILEVAAIWNRTYRNSSYVTKNIRKHLGLLTYKVNPAVEHECRRFFHGYPGSETVLALFLLRIRTDALMRVRHMIRDNLPYDLTQNDFIAE